MTTAADIRNKDRRDRIIKILIFMLLADLVIAVAIVYLLSPQGAEALEFVKSIPLLIPLKWFMGTVVVLIVFGTLFALARSRAAGCPPEFARFANEAGLQPVRKWGRDGGFGNVSLFGHGPYYEVPFNGLSLRYSQLVPELFPRGGRLSLYHSRTLPPGIFCRYRLKRVFTESRLPDEFKDVFAKKLDLGKGDLEIWAVKEAEAAALFGDERVSGALADLEVEITKPAETNPEYSENSGFIISDKALTVIFEDAAAISKSLVDSMYRLGNALTASPVAAGDPSPGTLDRLYKPVVATLVILTILAIIAQVATSVREFLGW